MIGVADNTQQQRTVLLLRPDELAFLLRGQHNVGLHLPQCVCESLTQEGDAAMALVALVRAGHVVPDTSKPLRIVPTLKEALLVLGHATHTLVLNAMNREGSLYLYPAMEDGRFVALFSNGLSNDSLEIGTFLQHELAEVVQEWLISSPSFEPEENDADGSPSEQSPVVSCSAYFRNEAEPYKEVDPLPFLDSPPNNKTSSIWEPLLSQGSQP